MKKDINKNEPWIDHLKNKLEDYSDQSPIMKWDQFEKELLPLAKPIAKIKPIWKMAAAAVLIAAISSIGLYFIQSNHFKNISETIVEAIEHNETLILTTQTIDKLESVAQAQTHSSKYVSKIKTGDSNHETLIINENTSYKNEIENEVAATVCNDDETLSQNKESNKNIRTAQKPSSKDKYHLPNEPNKTKTKNKPSIGVGVGNAGNFAINKNIGISDGPNRISLSDLGLIDIPNNHTLIFNDGIPYLLRSDEIINAKHHQPITVGLSFKYPIKNGFSIETGLNFTLLSSDITLANSIYTSHNQKLYYLGVPLKAIWDFLNTRYLTLYASAGGQIEKCIYGKFGNSKIDDRPLQFSAIGGLGAQFNVTQRLGMYIEPGIAYYFKDGSNLQTIRKEHPFNFNIQAGLRFTY